jgi:drug/metabolite transporter (DMT)-like permease
MNIMSPATRDYLMLLALGAVWGGNFLLIKLGVATIPATSFAVMRLTIAAVTMAGLAIYLGESFRFPRATWGAVLLASVSGNALPFVLIGWGQHQVDAGIAAICMGVMPLATILLAHLFTADEKLDGRKVLGVMFGFAGLVILIGPKSLMGLGNQAIAEIAICLGALCYGVNALATKALRRFPLSALAAVTFGIAAVVDLPLALLWDQPWTLQPSHQSLIALVALATLPTGLGTLVMFDLIKRLGVSFFSQINFIVPVFGVLWGALLLGETPPVNALLALACILAGIAVTRRRA